MRLQMHLQGAECSRRGAVGVWQSAACCASGAAPGGWEAGSLHVRWAPLVLQITLFVMVNFQGTIEYIHV